MSPQGKANIIRAIQDNNKDSHVFMCGDGGNDVGALKQVGLIFFSFFDLFLIHSCVPRCSSRLEVDVLIFFI